MYIEKINQPTDVKNLNSEQLHVLADEMRQALAKTKQTRRTLRS